MGLAPLQRTLNTAMITIPLVILKIVISIISVKLGMARTRI